MADLPPVELLEATHNFPCAYVFKAIGRGDETFIALVVAIVREELQQEFDPPYEVNHSSRGRHVSVTVSPWVESAAQVLAVYERIRTVDGLVMML